MSTSMGINNLKYWRWYQTDIISVSANGINGGVTIDSARFATHHVSSSPDLVYGIVGVSTVPGYQFMSLSNIRDLKFQHEC